MTSTISYLKSLYQFYSAPYYTITVYVARFGTFESNAIKKVAPYTEIKMNIILQHRNFSVQSQQDFKQHYGLLNV